MYSGLLIKESLCDEHILDCVEIKNVEIWATDNIPKYWTAISFESKDAEFPKKLSKALNDDYEMLWYVDMAYNGIKYIVLKDNVLKYRIGDFTEREAVMNKCRELGIPQQQLDWSE